MQGGLRHAIFRQKKRHETRNYGNVCLLLCTSSAWEPSRTDGAAAGGVGDSGWCELRVFTTGCTRAKIGETKRLKLQSGHRGSIDQSVSLLLLVCSR
mmetsp:Transcript_13546/g.25061  ORF Transcript_13546/g.25061 Transcript_13546/m.25061 type:complete len:97 (-) Transcript_13546:173-463(-)